VIIIEHHLDVIKQADWIIDLGPEGGEAGGRIVAQGTPEQVARSKKSYTGAVLARVLNGNGANSTGKVNGVATANGAEPSYNRSTSGKARPTSGSVPAK
jgi:excinuclease ABC subunit A